MRDPFDSGPPDALVAPAAIHKAYHETVQIKRPRKVVQMAERANELIALYAKGGIAAVRGALTPQEMAARARQERVMGPPEKELTEEEALRILAGDATPADAAERRAREEAERAVADLEAEGGRAVPDDTQ